MSRVRDIVALVKPRITLMVVARGVVGLYRSPKISSGGTKRGLVIGMSQRVGGGDGVNRYGEGDREGRGEDAGRAGGGWAEVSFRVPWVGPGRKTVLTGGEGGGGGGGRGRLYRELAFS